MSEFKEKDFSPPLPNDGFVTHIENKSSNTTVPPPTPATTAESLFSEPAYAEHGAPIDRAPTKEDIKPAGKNLLWPRLRRRFREPLSEFMGTFFLIMFGDGVVAQVVLSNGQKGDYQSISWGWGIGVLFGV